MTRLKILVTKLVCLFIDCTEICLEEWDILNVIVFVQNFNFHYKCVKEAFLSPTASGESHGIKNQKNNDAQ